MESSIMIRIFLTFLLLMLLGCGSKTTSPNEAPRANIILSSQSVIAGESISLDGSSSRDNDGKIVSYLWKDEIKRIGNTPKINWTAPKKVGRHIITLTVTDDDGATNKQAIMITIKAANAQEIIAKPTTPKSTVLSGELFTLSGRDSTAAQGDILSYRWEDSQHHTISNSVDTAVRISRPSGGVATFFLTVTDDRNNQDTKPITITILGNTGSLANIQQLISSGGISYILVGDSTRASSASPYFNANSSYKSSFFYPRLQSALQAKGVTSYLLARQGHEAKQFNNESMHPTWRDVVNRIGNNGDTTGEHSIVDICLGINDLYSEANGYNGTVSDIKNDLRDAIAKIKAQKPRTHFILTIPNPEDPMETSASGYTTILRDAYVQLSAELHYPLINVIDGINFTHNMYKNDIVHFHLIKSAQEQVAAFIAGKVLP